MGDSRLHLALLCCLGNFEKLLMLTLLVLRRDRHWDSQLLLLLVDLA